MSDACKSVVTKAELSDFLRSEADEAEFEAVPLRTEVGVPELLLVVTRMVCVTGFCFNRLCGCFGWKN